MRTPRTPDPGPRTPDPGPRTPDPGALGVSRGIVLAGRTLQALARLHFDLAPLLAVDPRIRLTYALNEGSDRRHLAERRALHLGIPLIPWKMAVDERPDLVISASADPELYEADAPVALVPHGATYNRVLKGLSGAAGTAREQLVGPGGELPAFMAMPGRAAVDQLAADCPAALPGAEVTGDLCMERLRISAPLRRAYRESLGVAPHRTLVVVSSTWGPYSLTATDRSLPEHLMAALPADEFALAYVPHPNIDADHGGNLLAYLRPRLRNGLVMVPPEEGWRAALIAADCVVGDSGSVTFYAANLGRPVLLAAFGFDEMAPGSPQEAFGRAAAWLRRDAEPAAQIREAIAGRASVADAAGDRPAYLSSAWSEPEPGPAARVLARVYELIGLAPMEAEPELLPRPVPIRESHPMNAWHCDIGREHATTGECATWTRYPASAPVSAVASEDAHLVVAESCLVRVLRGDAAVFLHHDAVRSTADAGALLEETFADYPRCELVSVRVGTDEALVSFRDGRRLRLRCDGALLDIVPSVLFAHGSIGEVRLRLGGTRSQVLLERFQ